jgi:hypothetical protein
MDGASRCMQNRTTRMTRARALDTTVCDGDLVFTRPLDYD